MRCSSLIAVSMADGSDSGVELSANSGGILPDVHLANRRRIPAHPATRGWHTVSSKPIRDSLPRRTGVPLSHDAGHHVPVERRRSAQSDTLRPLHGQRGLGPLTHEVALVLGGARHIAEHEPAGGGTGVDLQVAHDQPPPLGGGQCVEVEHAGSSATDTGQVRSDEPGGLPARYGVESGGYTGALDRGDGARHSFIGKPRDDVPPLGGGAGLDSGPLRLKTQTRHGLFLGAHAQVTNGGGLVTGDVAASGLPRCSHDPILNQTDQWYKQRGRPHSRETARAPWCWLSRTATGT